MEFTLDTDKYVVCKLTRKEKTKCLFPLAGVFNEECQKCLNNIGVRSSRYVDTKNGNDVKLWEQPKMDGKRIPFKKKNLPGRNDPCPCDSGKKFKKCCGVK